MAHQLTDGSSETNAEGNGNHSCCSMLMFKAKNFLKLVFTWKILKPVLYGQGLSLLICGTAVTSTYLFEFGISVPLTQSFINYVLLFLVYTSMLCFKKNEDGKRLIVEVFPKLWWKYLLLSIVDVEANYMVVMAYQYTSLTSVQLLDCFVIPVVMILSYMFLKVRYILVHYVGVIIALVGVGCMVGADVLVGKGGEAGTNPALGDVLVLAGAVGYGITNVSIEYISKNHNYGNIKYLGMIGLFSPLICGIQLAILERKALAAISWNWKVVLLLAAFGLCMFLLYSLLPIVMKLSSATAVNISLLTADLYALFAGLFLFKDKLSALYIVSFITIVVALIIYNSRQPLSRTSQSSRQDSEASQLNSLPTVSTEEVKPLQPHDGTWFSRSECGETLE